MFDGIVLGLGGEFCLCVLSSPHKEWPQKAHKQNFLAPNLVQGQSRKFVYVYVFLLSLRLDRLLTPPVHAWLIGDEHPMFCLLNWTKFPFWMENWPDSTLWHKSWLELSPRHPVGQPQALLPHSFSQFLDSDFLWLAMLEQLLITIAHKKIAELIPKQFRVR